MLDMMAPGLESLTVYSVGSTAWPVIFSAMLDRRNAPDGRLPQLISVSAGDCETDDGRAEVRLTEHVLAAAAAAGITVAAGSGDAGSFCTEGPRRGFYPSASRWVTSVGGTALTLDEANRIVDEIPWNDQSFAPRGLAGGGGFSRYLTRPPYQHGLDGWGDHRGYPDVALMADSYPGIAIYCKENAKGNCDPNVPGNPFTSVDGTSAATPQFIGLVALADQRLLAAGRPKIGFANPLLYRLGRSGGGALRDVVTGSILFNPGYGCCDAHPGYDLASGWGSVNAERLAALTP
jgi:kumamolisin